ncbi:hypothetical protein UZ38_37670 [Bacillus amyloliquefaciens]|nr:hypothetical protein UZ38_37670 [Bacillus amyloliquefaciens]
MLASSNTPSDKKVTEYFVKGTQPTTVSKKYEEKEDADKPTGLSAEYDEASKSIKLSWSYSGDGDVSFKVKQSVDGGGYSEIQSSSAKEAVIPNAKEGSVYRFQVTAVTEDGESDPASVTLKVNAAEDDESKADDEKKDEDDEKKQDADADDDQDKDKQNNGNSNQPDDQNSGNTDQNNQNPGNTDGRKDDDADDQNKDQNKDKNKNPDQDSNTDDQQTNSNGQSTGTH